MKKQRIIFLFLIFIASIHIYSQTYVSELDNEAKMDAILKKCGEYSEKVERASLYFVCIEKVKEEVVKSLVTSVTSTPGTSRSIRTFSSLPKWEKNTYVYDYQLIKKGDRITEKRILIEENGEERYLDNAPLKTKRFYSRWSALGPSIFFSSSWQENYSYRLIKEDKYKGERVYIIEAIPKDDIKEKLNYGKAWVNKEDGSIMKIEIDMESLSGFDELKEKIEKERTKPVFKTVHYFEYEKNGIRFPSKTIFEEDYIEWGGRKYKKSKTTFTYSNYKFFTVETDYVIKKGDIYR